MSANVRIAKKSETDRVLALAIARGSSIASAARVAGYSERHARRLLADPAFAKQIAGIRAELWSRTCGFLTALNIVAARRLKALLSSRDEAVQLRAVRIALQASAAVRETVEIQERLQKIESRLAEFPTLRGYRAKVTA